FTRGLPQAMCKRDRVARSPRRETANGERQRNQREKGRRRRTQKARSAANQLLQREHAGGLPAGTQAGPFILEQRESRSCARYAFFSHLNIGRRAASASSTRETGNVCGAFLTRSGSFN